MRYRWLQLSDLHSYCYGIRTRIMRQSLLDEIREMHESHPFDFLIITGDICNKSNGYDDAAQYIKKIMNIINISGNKVFLVPGNHDLDRKIPKDREDIVHELWDLELLEGRENEAIDKLIPAQNEYFKLYKDITGDEYPIEELHFIKQIDKNINIIHLNTSWMCYDSDNEDSKLHIGLQHVYNTLDKKDNLPINIAIGHHRLDDLSFETRNSIKSLFKTNDIDVYLGGHCHKSIVSYDDIIQTEVCSCRQVNADNADYPAGFIVGTINTIDEQSSFIFFSWSKIHSKWTYDYTVDVAKHGKYYLKNTKFNKTDIINRDIVIDFKLMGGRLNLSDIKRQLELEKTADYKYPHKDIRPTSDKDWNKYLKDLVILYKQVIEASNGKNIHIFPMAPIPLQVSLGYLLQNNSSNIKIYQYNENDGLWCYDSNSDNIKANIEYKNCGKEKLAILVMVSNSITEEDLNDVVDNQFDYLELKIENPQLCSVNYHADIKKLKTILKQELDRIYSKYNEIHLFLAAPSALCIEIGRIIRENMYPDTYVYNYKRSDQPRYSKVFNLKDTKQVE